MRTITRRDFVRISLGTGGALLSSAATIQAQTQTGAFPTAIAITQIFGEGEKLTAIALGYESDVVGDKLSTETYKVDSRIVTKAYSSKTAAVGKASARGRYVIVELSTADPNALLIGSPSSAGKPPGGPPLDGAQGPRPQGVSNQAGGPGSGNPARKGPRTFPKPVIKPAVATITQIQDVLFADGKHSTPSPSSITTTGVSTPIVDDFRQLTYHDPKNGYEMGYNLFVPHNYDKRKLYPLVLFIHDAGVLTDNTKATLLQGLGAVVWASPEDQAKRECFVVAPQFSTVGLGENHEITPAMEASVALVEHIASEYSIDKNRIYSTGQSMGASMTIGMNIAHPDLFAASYIVAGQWDPESARSLGKRKLWIVVSQGDLQAYPGENAMSALWEQDGAHVSRSVWNGRATSEEFNGDVKEMEAKHTPINYAALQRGTVVLPGQSDSGGNNHTNTWRIAYTIEGIRAWLFQQHK